MIKNMHNTIFNKQGFRNKQAYLNSLSGLYHLDMITITNLSNLVKNENDIFESLPSIIERYKNHSGGIK